MRLKELEGRLIRRELRSDGDYRVNVAIVQEADGVRFLCPKCFDRNKGAVGTHMIVCWFVGKVPDDLDPKPGRWNPSGVTIDDLTFVPPGAVSVYLPGPGSCLWHGHVRNGEATLS